jgi:hypothetical protein
LIGNDGLKEIKKSITVQFCNRIFWGVSEKPTEYNKDFLDTLNYELQNNKNKTITVNARNNQYIYYSVPSAYGNCIMSVNGFIGGFKKVATISYTNMYNNTENYDIYESDNSNLGNTIVVIQ